MAGSEKTHRVVIVGAGFAGFNAARELVQLVGAATEVVVINSTDYFLYLPLMPQVAGGMVEPRHICASLPRRLRKARFVLGTVYHVDSRQKVVSWSGPEGASAGWLRPAGREGHPGLERARARGHPVLVGTALGNALAFAVFSRDGSFFSSLA